MPYYVDRRDLTVVVTAPGRARPSNDCVPVDQALAVMLRLNHGTSLTAESADALLNGDVERFRIEQGEEVTPDCDSESESPQLPAAGRWEYRVLPLTEVFGFATASGTAARMEAALNLLAADGWELLTTSERDSRWISGETVMLTFRRFIVTESEYLLRATAEERLRRQACAALDMHEHLDSVDEAAIKTTPTTRAEA